MTTTLNVFLNRLLRWFYGAIIIFGGGYYPMMTYLRENGLKIVAVLVLLAAFTPSGLPWPLFAALNQAQFTLEHQHYPETLISIEQALSFEPALQGLHKPALDLALLLGQWDRAETHLRALQAINPASRDLVCAELKVQLALSGIPGNASALAQSIECPAEIDSLRQLGYELFLAGDFDAAIPLLENLVISQPESNQEQAMLALYFAAVDPDNAIDPLRKSQAVQNQFTRLALDLLILIQDNQNLDSPAYLSAIIGQRFARAEEWYLAHEAFLTAVHLDTEYAQAWGYLGVSQDNIGLDGEDAYQEAVRLSPEDSLLLVLKAMHFNRIGEASMALPILERAAELDGENPAIAAELGHTYASLGDLDLARLAYAQATVLAPDEASFWQILAEFSLHYEIEVRTLGLPAARNALILQPFADQNWRMLGYAHFLLEDFQLAERALVRAVDIAPTDPTVHYYLGLLFQAQGRSAEAIAAWTMASRLSPDHPYAHLSQRALDTISLVP